MGEKPERIKVAVVGTFGAGQATLRGPQRVARELAQGLRAAGEVEPALFEMVVPRQRSARFLARGTESLTLDGVGEVVRLTPRSLLETVGGYPLAHFLGTLSVYTLPGLYRLRRRGVPVVATLNGLFATERRLGYPYGRLDVWAEALGLRYVTRAVAVSETLRELAEATYPACRGKTRVIEHGVPAFAVQAEGGPPGAADVILCAGGTDRVKGIPFLLAALLGWDGAADPPCLVLVGRTGSEHAQVVEQARALGDRFSYQGEVSTETLAQLYSQCRVYVQPSLYEPFGMTILEAMAHGRPVVVTRQCGCASLIEDGTNGFVVEHGDVNGLRAALDRLLSEPGLAERMGRRARETAQAYTWERAARRYAEVYRDCTSRGP